jgi:DNA-binding NarL/FixJ family response regulator
MIKIFVTDDQRLVRQFVKEALVDIPDFLIVGEADSGEETIELIPEVCPDVLVTDLSMKGMNGIQVTENVRRLFPEIKVIVWTVSTDYIYALGAKKAGASGFVVKDAGIGALIDAIHGIDKDGFYLSPLLSNQRFNEFRRGFRC